MGHMRDLADIRQWQMFLFKKAFALLVLLHISGTCVIFLLTNHSHNNLKEEEDIQKYRPIYMNLLQRSRLPFTINTSCHMFMSMYSLHMFLPG